MALPTLKDVKERFGLKTTAEDSLLTSLLVEAQALLETAIGIPLIAIADSMIDDTTTSMRAYYAPTQLRCDRYPIANAVVTDTQSGTVDSATYRVDARAGLIIANAGVSFGNGPYTITGDVGLSSHPDYANRLEPLARTVLLDIIADLYQRRNPGAMMETAGGGVSVQYSSDAIPPRTRGLVALLRRNAGFV